MSPNVRHSLSIELALLGFLRQGPLHGYQIHQQLSGPSGLSQVWRLKQSQLYALLARLDEAGYISGTLQAQESRPARRVYSLTPLGEAIYLEWVRSPVSVPRQIRQEFLTKLYFARREGVQAYAELVMPSAEPPTAGWRTWKRAPRSHQTPTSKLAGPPVPHPPYSGYPGLAGIMPDGSDSSTHGINNATRLEQKNDPPTRSQFLWQCIAAGGLGIRRMFAP